MNNKSRFLDKTLRPTWIRASLWVVAWSCSFIQSKHLHPFSNWASFERGRMLERMCTADSWTQQQVPSWPACKWFSFVLNVWPFNQFRLEYHFIILLPISFWWNDDGTAKVTKQCDQRRCGQKLPISGDSTDSNDLWLKRFSLRTCHFTSAEDTGVTIIPISWSAPDPWSTGPTAHIEVIYLKLV
jgi:hypothetical protein